MNSKEIKNPPFSDYVMLAVGYGLSWVTILGVARVVMHLFTCGCR